MPIQAQDIKLLASERLTDNADGGGRITGAAIQDGADNNLFDDVADLDRVTGRVSLRKAAVAVQTPDTDKYLASRVMVAEIPADPATHGVLFSTTHPDDLRSDAVIKLASYLAPGGTYAGLLYGNHLAGMASVILLQRDSVPLPVVGDVLYLVQDEGTASQRSQYARITTVSALPRTFEGQGGAFNRLQVTCGISSPLSKNFDGFEAQQFDAQIIYTGKTRVREVVVADAAEYFGTKPLTEAAALGDLSLKVDTAFEQLLPSSQIETPLANRDPAPPTAALVGSGTTVSYSQLITWNSTTSLSLASTPLPGTLSITTNAGTITDRSGRLRLNGAEVGAVDYASGICTISGDRSGQLTISYQGAGRAARAPMSAGVPVNIASRAINYAVFLDPPPLRGSASVSYRAQGRWYTLFDDGSGGLQGTTSGLGAGSVNYIDGYATATLGALPDIGSAVIFQWSGATQETAWPVATLKAEHTMVLPGTEAIQPGSVVISWARPGWGTQTSSDAAQPGILAGDATGTVNYGERRITLQPNLLPPVGTVLTIAWSAGPKFSHSIAAPARNASNQVAVTSPSAIVPGSLEVEWVGRYSAAQFYGEYLQAQAEAMGWPLSTTSTFKAYDNGSGALRYNGSTIGTVNYTTGAVVFNPDVQVNMPRPVFTTQWSGSNAQRAVFRGVSYSQVTSIYMASPSDTVILRYNNSASATAASTTAPIALSLDAVPGYSLNLLPGSLHLAQGTRVYACSGTGLLRSGADYTGLINAGTINLAGGRITLTQWVGEYQTNAFTRQSCISLLGDVISSQYLFRTAAAPIKPGSFSVRFARSTGGVQTVTAAPDGTLSASGVSGTFNYETGVCSLNFGDLVTAAGNETQPWYKAEAVQDGKIWRPAPVASSTIRYSAVSYTYLPLSDDLLGVPSTQLPQDGRVVIYKPGRVLVAHHTQSTAPQTVSAGTTVNTGRTLLAWARVYGANGAEITTGFAKDLDAGTITFTNVSGYSQPVTVRSRIETEALCVDATIDGTLRLNRPLAHAYPAQETLISSVLVGGTLQAGTQPSFSQATWTNTWSNDRQGAAILAQYDQATRPITVTNEGAITQRWAIIFTSATQFRVVGETRGQIVTGDTSTQLAPVNPFTGAPLFTLQPAGWGSGWAAGNVLRFNTVGATLPFWVARTVEQSNPAAPGTDQLTLEVRGSIDA